MSRKAFLAGLNNFATAQPSLHGCVNDTLAMQALLKTHYGFQDSEIRIAHDGDATNAGIRAGLAWLLSEYDAHDVRVFHFSSHGTQVPDEQSGPGADEQDATDEVIVTYDHDWDHPFRDDDLRHIFAAVPPTVNFTFIADCCHSGTIQRALLESGIEFTPRYLTPPPDLAHAITEAESRRAGTGDRANAAELAALVRDTPPDQLDARMRDFLAAARKARRKNRYGVAQVDRNYLLAACQDTQTAADAQIGGTYHGAFTWALCQAVEETQGRLTYDDAIARIADHLRPYDQNPQLECPANAGARQLFAPLA
jgi:metacaspase-1